jgi:hypothetical protein
MSLRSLKLKSEYRTGADDLVRDFYTACARTSVRYDRAVGYFRSSILLLAGGAIVDLALRNGYVRLICSPDLTEEDLDAMHRGYEEREHILSSALIFEISRLLEDVATKDAAVVLATLIATGALGTC